MVLSSIDWVIISAFFVFSLIVGIYYSRRSGNSAQEYFLSGRNMPWWLLGVSMVATTFSADTPNLVTDIVRKNGVAGNWAWWAFLLTGMLTVFVYTKLWRRSGITTDVEFYELRYGGKPARVLRGFRSLYLGVLFNVLIMASVSLAAIKIGAVLLGLSSGETLLIATAVTVLYSSLGGLRSVLITDFVQFIIAMVGSVAATIYIVNTPQVGGLAALLDAPAVSSRMSLLPDFSDSSTLIPLLIIPLAVQWWSVWYPGAEPGGGGYVAQRFLSARDEKNALTATFLFNIMHYALRPWPWILIAFASLVVFPDLDSLAAAFPGISRDTINDDLAYPAMLQLLPAGLIGIVVASLIAAYMSTISTHLNWGSSYIVNDFYKRFVKPDASDKELVGIGRIATVVLAVFSAFLALALSNALSAFQILIQIGAGTGLIFILRWFWWRINAWTEITGMVVSFLVAVYFEFVHGQFFDPMPDHWRLVAGVGITTALWLLVTFLTRPEKDDVLVNFIAKIKPVGIGWQPVLDRHPDLIPGKNQLSLEILMMVVGAFTIYALLFATGFWIYGNTMAAMITTTVAVAGTILLMRNWKRLSFLS